MDDPKAMDERNKRQFLIELKALLDDWFPPGYIVFETGMISSDESSPTELKATVMAQQALTEATMTITIS